MMHRNQLWRIWGQDHCSQKSSGSNKSLSHEEAEHIQATDSDWVLSWRIIHNLPWGQGVEEYGGGDWYFECLPDPWNSTYMISYHPQDQKADETILQAWRTRLRRRWGRSQIWLNPYPSSSSHATMSPCTSCLLTQWKMKEGTTQVNTG